MSPVERPAPLWQCSSRTCNHQHTEAERVRVPRPKDPGIRDLTCPACGHLNYFPVRFAPERPALPPPF